LGEGILLRGGAEVFFCLAADCFSLVGQLLFMNSGLRSYWAYRPIAVVVWGGSDWVTMA
jgi:hypothetical protein